MVCTRVSRACWPCLRVIFLLEKITHKKSQHRAYRFAKYGDLRRVHPPPLCPPVPSKGDAYTA